MRSLALIAAIIAAALVAAFSWAGVATLSDPCVPLSSMFDTVAQCRAVEALRASPELREQGVRVVGVCNTSSTGARECEL